MITESPTQQHSGVEQNNGRDESKDEDVISQLTNGVEKRKLINGSGVTP